MATRILQTAILASALTTGCATQGAYLNEGPTALGKPPYQVGPVTVVIRPQSEVELICRPRSPHAGTSRLAVVPLPAARA